MHWLHTLQLETKILDVNTFLPDFFAATNNTSIKKYPIRKEKKERDREREWERKKERYYNS